MKILDRYNTAVHASSLKSEATTTWADADVLGAAGLAARHEALGIALARMLAGGGRSDVVRIMATEVFERSFRIKARVTLLQAEDIAKAVLAWYSHGTCQPCGGTGFARIKDTPSLGDECQHCGGTGRTPFDQQFRHEHRDLARWLQDQIGATQARAGRLAMTKIADSLDFWVVV
jgi:hypothetical protein